MEKKGVRDAYLLGHFQTGLKNVLDRAVLQTRSAPRAVAGEYSKVVKSF